MLTIIEKILNSEHLDQSALADIRLRMFALMAANPTKAYTMRCFIQELGLPDNRRLLQPMMNVLFQYNLANFDYNSKAYSYKDSPESRQLLAYITMLKAM